jgi:hypothetical protein
MYHLWEEHDNEGFLTFSSTPNSVGINDYKIFLKKLFKPGTQEIARYSM